MLGLIVTFLILALIAGVLGFTGLVVAFAGLAKILFVIFLVFFLISLVTHRRHPVVQRPRASCRSQSLAFHMVPH